MVRIDPTDPNYSVPIGLKGQKNLLQMNLDNRNPG